jgi:hypothetical protein
MTPVFVRERERALLGAEPLQGLKRSISLALSKKGAKERLAGNELLTLNTAKALAPDLEKARRD